MRNINKKIFLIILFLISACTSTTEKSEKLSDTEKKNLPEWVMNFNYEDKINLYYIGNATGTTKQLAIENAYKNALENATEENFGIYIQSDFSIKTKNTDENIEYNLSSQTKKAKVVGFKKVDEYSIHLNKKYEAWVYYKYPKKEIEKEKKRLEKIYLDDDDYEFSVVGNDDKKGTVEFITLPIGAAVYVDGTRYGQTPLRLVGNLKEGKHFVRFDHPEFEIENSEFNVSQNEKTIIKKALKQAKGFLKVQTTPSNANIYINEKLIGKSPLNIKIDAYKNLKLKIKHDLTNTMELQIKVARDERKNLDLELVRKTGLVSIYTYPEGASIYLKNEFIGNTPLENIPVAEEFAFIKIEKQGYNTERKKIPVDATKIKSVKLDLVKINNQNKTLDKTLINLERLSHLGDF